MSYKFLAGVLVVLFLGEHVNGFQTQKQKQAVHPYQQMPDVMPGTKLLSIEGDLSIQIIDGAHRFIEKKIEQAGSERQKLWRRDLSSTAAYERSVEPNRRSFMKNLGIQDKSQPLDNYNVGFPDRNPPVSMEKFAVDNDAEIIAETSRYRVYQVRWPVLDRMYGAGLLLQPKTKAVGNIIAIPDADQLPEQLAGLSPGINAESQFARRLAENGFQVLIPVLANRSFLFQGTEKQQTHREWIYRQAFHMGGHIIGYEIQKIISAIDWFEKTSDNTIPVGVAGYHEGGLIAFYAAAIDKRIDATMVSGYFQSRERTWDEPLYRNVWGLLSEFGDAEIASLIAPRPLIIEYSGVPKMAEQVAKPGDENKNINGWPFTGYKGTLQTPDFSKVKSEYNRIEKLTRPGFQPLQIVAGKDDKPVAFGSTEALLKFSGVLGHRFAATGATEMPLDKRSSFDPDGRQQRQVKEMEDHVQWLMRDSDQKRNQFFLYKMMPEFSKRTWSTKAVHPTYDPDKVINDTKLYRKIFHEDIIGKFEDAVLPPNAHTRKIYDNERWTGYEVMLDVFPELSAAGVLLIPKDLKATERRPVVVCQHGRDDVPQKLIEGNNSAYNNVAAKLADSGFIVYAPYNPYRGEDKYRWLNRKANTLKKTLFSFIVSQHDQTIRWLGSLPFVDKERIAFYGLSYGGETAMRVPAVLEGYCLSICAGDFGDWTRKVVDTHFKGGFMNSLEWEMPYFNMGGTFSYAEMAYLIFPRPFMVERGHDDLVQPDEWVAYEYGKVNYFYDQFDLGDRTEIEYFNGGHSMRGEGTFEFLHKHLKWPEDVKP